MKSHSLFIELPKSLIRNYELCYVVCNSWIGIIAVLLLLECQKLEVLLLLYTGNDMTVMVDGVIFLSLTWSMKYIYLNGRQLELLEN